MTPQTQSCNFQHLTIKCACGLGAGQPFILRHLCNPTTPTLDPAAFCCKNILDNITSMTLHAFKIATILLAQLYQPQLQGNIYAILQYSIHNSPMVNRTHQWKTTPNSPLCCTNNIHNIRNIRWLGLTLIKLQYFNFLLTNSYHRNMYTS